MTAQTVGSSFSARAELWFNSAQAWLDKPLFGNGWGSFEAAYAPHRADHLAFMNETILTVPSVSPGAAHNDFLQLLVELGIVGFVLWGLLFLRCMSWVLAAGLVMALIEFPFQNPATALLLALALGYASRSASPAYSGGRVFKAIAGSVISRSRS